MIAAEAAAAEAVKTPETVAAEAKVAEEKATEDAKSVVPETYADFTFPEGIEADKAALEAALPVFQELKLTQDQAQKLVGLQTAQLQATEVAKAAEWEKTNDEWRDEAKSDPEFGGANLQGNLAHISTFLNKFATPEFRTMLDETGLGNRKEALAVFASIGKAMSEDKISVGTVVNPGKKPLEQLLYGGTTQP